MVSIPDTGPPRLLVAPDSVGGDMHALISELYPVCRSLTGAGVRETFDRLAQHVPLKVTELATGTQVFDWTVPKEWSIRDAWISDVHGKKIVDFQRSNLHVLGYSVPVRRTVSLDELREHVFALPEHPEWIPWRTSYYHENWGFSLTQNQLDELTDDEYLVCIDSSLDDGSLTYAEVALPGETRDEVLISSYVCHPSLCNDGLSGIALITMLAKYLQSVSLRYSYRFLLSPGTIGPLAWLSLNEARLANVKHGLVVSCVGDPGRLTYKKSRRGDAEIDQAAVHVLKHSASDHAIEEFTPWGGDERQFCSPGFNLPVGSLMRTPPGRFPEYHTSADDLEFVRPASLADSFAKYLAVVSVLEGNATYVNQNPKGEPQLGRRGLYRAISSGTPREDELRERALLWVLNLSDGNHTLLDIADRANLSFFLVRAAADALCDHDLLKAVGRENTRA